MIEGLDGVECQAHAHMQAKSGELRAANQRKGNLCVIEFLQIWHARSRPQRDDVTKNMQPVDDRKLEGMPSKGEASLGDMVPGASNAGKWDQMETTEVSIATIAEIGRKIVPPTFLHEVKGT